MQTLARAAFVTNPASRCENPHRVIRTRVLFVCCDPLRPSAPLWCGSVPAVLLFASTLKICHFPLREPPGSCCPPLCAVAPSGRCLPLWRPSGAPANRYPCLPCSAPFYAASASLLLVSPCCSSLPWSSKISAPFSPAVLAGSPLMPVC